MPDALSALDVTFRYGAVPILRKVSLSLAEGSLLGLVGPNGSGKTTLLRVMAGLLRPDEGDVTWQGRSIRSMSRVELARLLALVPQNASLPGSFSALELVMMGRTPYLGFLGREGPRDFMAVEKAMEMANCLDLADRRIGELSGGERQRVLLARALAQEPRILVLDEPTAHMDAHHQVAMTELVAGMVAGGLTAISVFHDLNLAACYCHRLAMLSGGHLVAYGTPEEVLTAETLAGIYGTELCLTKHPQSGGPAVLPPGRWIGRNGARS